MQTQPPSYPAVLFRIRLYFRQTGRKTIKTRIEVRVNASFQLLELESVTNKLQNKNNHHYWEIANSCLFDGLLLLLYELPDYLDLFRVF